MAATSQEKWRIGSTATSLLVAYLLVLQGVVAVFAGQQPGQSGFSAGVLCASPEGVAAPDGKTTPTRSQRHGEKCCAVHASSAGAPPPSAETFSPQRSWRMQASYFARAVELRAPRPLLPLGSRAPPVTVA